MAASSVLLKGLGPSSAGGITGMILGGLSTNVTSGSEPIITLGIGSSPGSLMPFLTTGLFPSASSNQAASADPITVTPSVGTPTVVGSGTATLVVAAVSVTSSITTPTVVNSLTATASPIAATVSIPDVTVTGTGTVTATAGSIVITSSIPTHTVRKTDLAQPNAVSVTTIVPNPTINISGTGYVTASPVVATITIPTHTVTGAGTAAVVVDPVALTASVVTVSASQIATQTVGPITPISLTTTVPNPIGVAEIDLESAVLKIRPHRFITITLRSALEG